MTYNGYVADLFFNACAIALWAAFLWRVLDGPRFRDLADGGACRSHRGCVHGGDPAAHQRRGRCAR
ncbi:MAG: hypothetical protein ACLUNO_04070 [Oscillospiraceae bacterium]